MEDIELDDYMKYNKVTKLSNEKADNTEGILTYKEISTALYQMKSDKSPDISVFTADFFLNFLETARSLCTQITKLRFQ